MAAVLTPAVAVAKLPQAAVTPGSFSLSLQAEEHHGEGKDIVTGSI